jgi:hypothetical protein
MVSCAVGLAAPSAAGKSSCSLGRILFESCTTSPSGSTSVGLEDSSPRPGELLAPALRTSPSRAGGSLPSTAATVGSVEHPPHALHVVRLGDRDEPRMPRQRAGLLPPVKQRAHRLGRARHTGVAELLCVLDGRRPRVLPRQLLRLGGHPQVWAGPGCPSTAGEHCALRCGYGLPQEAGRYWPGARLISGGHQRRARVRVGRTPSACTGRAPRHLLISQHLLLPACS